MPSRQDNRRSLSASDKLALLRRHPLFGAIAPELLERLSSYATTRAVHRGDSIFGKGEIFGEIALLDGRPRTADATAMSDCELMVIERRDFLDLVRSQPEIALKLMEVLCARLRHTSEQVEDVLFLDLPGRLAKI